jgi:hypothetical protein
MDLGDVIEYTIGPAGSEPERGAAQCPAAVGMLTSSGTATRPSNHSRGCRRINGKTSMPFDVCASWHNASWHSGVRL